VKHPRAEIKFIDCPILSIVNYNQYKGHDKHEIFKVEDFQVTRQIKALNSEIVKLNDRLNKKTINISKYFFRGRKSVNITMNKKDGVHPGKLLCLAITKHILLDLSGHLEIFHFKDFMFVVSFVLIVVYDGQDWAVYTFYFCSRMLRDNSYSSVVLVKYTVYCFIILMSQADVFTFFTC
jgi:hypothetical protein